MADSLLSNYSIFDLLDFDSEVFLSHHKLRLTNWTLT
jgi:hypothetical protein